MILLNPRLNTKGPPLSGLLFSKRKALSAGTVLEFFKTKFCDVIKFEVSGRDTDSLYLAFAERSWKTVYALKRKQSGISGGQKILPIVSLLMHLDFFPPSLL